jgi:DNA-binding NtrC family response regulator
LVKVDVRVMAATHRDLEKAIADRTFREDLYYRLNVINIHIPPLRERKEDILPMADYLMKRHATSGAPPLAITPELKRAMTVYHWPGNVRELENVVRKLLILRDADVIARELNGRTSRRAQTSPTVPEAPSQAAALVAGGVESPILEQVTKAKLLAETDAILAALDSTRWNRKQAAALLKIDYKALLYKMKKLGVEEKAAARTQQADGRSKALTASASAVG